MRGLLPALLVAGLISAAPPAAGQAPARPVFRSGADLVRLDVRVTDAAGNPVVDLRPEEIEIIEDGAARPILLFDHLSSPPEQYAEAALRALSAEVSTNADAPRGHLYILVFDQAHIAPGNEQIARRAAEAFIKDRVRASDRVAVFGLPGPGPELGFTADRTRAIAELARVHGELQRNAKSAAGDLSIHEAYEIAAGNDKVLADVLLRQSTDLTADVGSAAPGQPGAVDPGRARMGEPPAVMRRIVLENARTVVAHADAAARDTLQRLADLLAQYRSVEGRKSVVLFSEGFHQHNVAREVEQVAAAAAQSYAVFYAFDLNRRAGGDISQPLIPSTSAAAEVLARTEPMGSLAAETDGALIPDATSHLSTALTRIAAQAEDYYLVGFSPSVPALAARGTYRRVSVRVTRPGLRAAARTGYATPGSARLPDRRAAIDAVLSAPFAQQGLRVEYTTYTLHSDNAGRARVLMSLEAHLPVRDSTDAAADVVFIVRDARNGRVVASGSDTVLLPASAGEQSATGVAAYRVHFDLPPGSYLMRTAVREPGGLTGSADRKLDVRGLSGPDVSAGDLILGSVTGALPVRARAFAQDGLTGLVEIYGRTPEQLQGISVDATLLAAGHAQPVAAAGAQLSETMNAGTGVVRRATFAMPLAAVSPGTYKVQVKVVAGALGVADPSRELEVVPGRRPLPPPPGDEPRPRLRPGDVLDGDFIRPARGALRVSTDSAAVRATEGFDMFARAEYAQAATALADALKMNQSSAAVAFVLGWAFDETGRTREAIGAWRAAATIDPKMVPAHLALADGYLRLSERALAEQAVRAGLAAVPSSPELQRKLADIARRTP